MPSTLVQLWQLKQIKPSLTSFLFYKITLIKAVHCPLWYLFLHLNPYYITFIANHIRGFPVSQEQHKLAATYMNDLISYVLWNIPNKSYARISKLMVLWLTLKLMLAYHRPYTLYWLQRGFQSFVNPCPFKWTDTDITNIGIQVTHSIDSIFEANFSPHFHLCWSLQMGKRRLFLFWP